MNPSISKAGSTIGGVLRPVLVRFVDDVTGSVGNLVLKYVLKASPTPAPIAVLAAVLRSSPKAREVAPAPTPAAPAEAAPATNGEAPPATVKVSGTRYGAKYAAVAIAAIFNNFLKKNSGIPVSGLMEFNSLPTM